MLIEGQVTLEKSSPRLRQVLTKLLDEPWKPEVMLKDGGGEMRLIDRVRASITLEFTFDFQAYAHIDVDETICIHDSSNVSSLGLVTVSVPFSAHTQTVAALRHALRGITNCRFLATEPGIEIDNLFAQEADLWNEGDLDDVAASKVEDFIKATHGSPAYFQALKTMGDHFAFARRRGEAFYRVANNVPGFRDYLMASWDPEIAEQARKSGRVIRFGGL